MKKLIAIVMLVVLLAGCAQPEAFETMSDIYYEPEGSPVRQTVLVLPEDAAVTVMEEETAGSIYLCDGYCVMVQTLASGDLDATLRSVTGYPREKLLVMERQDENGSRYECVWAAAGEGGDQVGRTLVLDDGSYHYTLTVMADAENAGDLADTWQGIFDSFRLGGTLETG